PFTATRVLYWVSGHQSHSLTDATPECFPAARSPGERSHGLRSLRVRSPYVLPGMEQEEGALFCHSQEGGGLNQQGDTGKRHGGLHAHLCLLPGDMREDPRMMWCCCQVVGECLP
uniref:Uncharacterized protein n=1 Tax=Oncorhynchus tshawytscha TaxID=74940 RepID=A0A8C8ME92_ONCTS